MHTNTHTHTHTHIHTHPTHTYSQLIKKKVFRRKKPGCRSDPCFSFSPRRTLCPSLQSTRKTTAAGRAKRLATSVRCSLSSLLITHKLKEPNKHLLERRRKKTCDVYLAWNTWCDEAMVGMGELHNVDVIVTYWYPPSATNDTATWQESYYLDIDIFIK